MARHAIDSAFGCPFSNPKGGPHALVYLGKIAQSYFCRLCDGGISKADLKRASDGSEISQPIG